MDKKTQNSKIISDIIQELFKLLEIEAKFTLEEKEGIVNIQVETDQPGIFIGYHGETLAALQLMIGMIFYRKSGEWQRILVNVGDYRERRQDALEKMALSVAQKVKFSQQSQALPPMSAAERRLVHVTLANDPEVETLSEGEGQQRHVVVRLKNV